jgi:hypothetical protein
MRKVVGATAQQQLPARSITGAANLNARTQALTCWVLSRIPTKVIADSPRTADPEDHRILATV